jgi:NitT/TauT family transport system permease protein
VTNDAGRLAAALAAMTLLAGTARFSVSDVALSLICGVLALAAGCRALALLARDDRRTARIASPLVFGLMLLGAWEVAVLAFGIPSILLPAPSAIAGAIGADPATLGGDFVQTVIRSVLPGYAIGCGTGFLVAVAIDRSPFLQRGLLPLSTLVSVMPIVGIAPIMVMWFGFDWPSKAAVVAIMTFFPMLANTIAGLAESGSMERDLMHCYAATYGQTLRKLRLPGALPHLFNALKLNSTLALIGAVVAEFFGTPIHGMGFRISTEAARMNMDMVWATITVAALTGCLSFGALALLERRVTFWHASVRRP